MHSQAVEVEGSLALTAVAKPEIRPAQTPNPSFKRTCLRHAA